MIDWYLPSFAQFGKSTILFSPDIEWMANISWTKPFVVPYKFIFYIEYIECSMTCEGIDVDYLFTLINKIKIPSHRKINKIDINKHNSFVHISNNEWNFYYPRDYENMIKLCKDKNLFSMNEYWIKNIIE